MAEAAEQWQRVVVDVDTLGETLWYERNGRKRRLCVETVYALEWPRDIVAAALDVARRLTRDAPLAIAYLDVNNDKAYATVVAAGTVVYHVVVERDGDTMRACVTGAETVHDTIETVGRWCNGG